MIMIMTIDTVNKVHNPYCRFMSTKITTGCQPWVQL